MDVALHGLIAGFENLVMNATNKADLFAVASVIVHDGFDIVTGDGDIFGRKPPDSVLFVIISQFVPTAGQLAKDKIRIRQYVIQAMFEVGIADAERGGTFELQGQVGRYER